MNKLPKFRNDLRLKSHNYAGGWYFVTLCTSGRANIFGIVENVSVNLSPAGELVQREWLRGAEIRENLALDAFVVMPNHLHAVHSLSGGRVGHRPTPTPGVADVGKAGTLGAVISQFKSVTTKVINRMRNAEVTAVWQRNYHDHIVRSDSDLLRIQNYIQNNPLKWQIDRENPDRIGNDEDDDYWFI